MLWDTFDQGRVENNLYDLTHSLFDQNYLHSWAALFQRRVKTVTGVCRYVLIWQAMYVKNRKVTTNFIQVATTYHQLTCNLISSDKIHPLQRFTLSRLHIANINAITCHYSFTQPNSGYTHCSYRKKSLQLEYPFFITHVGYPFFSTHPPSFTYTYQKKPT